ncbi:1303_t:CDS:1 [Ambispora leptoticha]|uniref:1303_t:CDS:1 n=1 Tax=Ambispora leptoticha TaxID=144679 RepID=A0A9N9CGC0_9GLOM|nr:1303_t:CDS:1 [Ambispora leptoticha]
MKNLILTLILTIVTFSNFTFATHLKWKRDEFLLLGRHNVDEIFIKNGSLVTRDVCGTGYHQCSDNKTCCPTGTICVPGGCCNPGYYHCSDNNGCCPNGSKCIPGTHKCDIGCGANPVPCYDGCCFEGEICLRASYCSKGSSPTTHKSVIPPPSETLTSETLTSESSTSKTLTSDTLTSDTLTSDTLTSELPLSTESSTPKPTPTLTSPTVITSSPEVIQTFTTSSPTAITTRPTSLSSTAASLAMEKSSAISIAIILVILVSLNLV